MGNVRDEDIASGETLQAAPHAPERATGLVGATLGRYRLERELGAGGMGVVYAAFDPDLERRVALKVLRVQAPTTESKERLLREARAMARLAHPNVVTVHEVGTAAGRDYVAMELIQGDTLADWLAATARPPTAIVDAFLAAGRGLAAAHAAGMVHRDFKPHNVLRGRDGRIVVTDFGLAREAADAPAAAHAITLLVNAQAAAQSTPSSLAGLTVTGALLGTPAYMAPEQWNQGAVTPATDQFAYCVALWEALAGERPYRGATFDDLRAEVTRGPDALDASRIPRRLRPILRRGLAPTAGQRWPSMTALIAQLERAQRRRGIAIAIAGAAVAVAAGVAWFALRGGPPPIAACEPPAHDPTAIWSPAIAADLRVKTSGAHAAVLETAFRDWQAARTQACGAAPQIQQAQLACLDGVLARFDALRQAYARVPGATADDLHGQLVAPEICRRPATADVPRLTLAPTPEVIAAYELYGRADTDHKPSDAELAQLIGKPNLDACARVVATLALVAASEDVPRIHASLSETISVVDQCGDERLRADLLIKAVPYLRERPVSGPRGEHALRQAEVAASRVKQPDVDAALALQHLSAEVERGRWDAAFRYVDVAIAGYGARGLHRQQVRAAIQLDDLRLQRALPADLRAVISDVATWRPIASANQLPDLALLLEAKAATARFWLGDVAEAHAELWRLWRLRPHRVRADVREIRGEVVDGNARPVAGASVAVGRNLVSDSIGIAVPLFEDDVAQQIVTTDAAGRFTISVALAAGVVAAQLGDRRSMSAAIADHVRLVLEPTRTVSGKVELGDAPYTRVLVVCDPDGEPTGRIHTAAPVAPDGSFTIAGVLVRAARVGVAERGDLDFTERVEYRALPASPASVTDLQLAISSSQRTLDVITHSPLATPLEAVQVVVLAGKHAIANLGELLRFQTTGTHVAYAISPTADAPPAVADKLRPGDLVAHLTHVHTGALTVCAFAIPGDLADHEDLKRMQAQFAKLAFKCEQVGPDASAVVVTVPPPQRLD